VKGYTFTATVANVTWIKANRDAVDRYLRAMIKAYDWITDKNNKADAVKVLVDISHQDQKYVEQTYDLYFDQGKDVFYPRQEINPSDLQGTLDARVALGEPKPTLPLERYLDTSFHEAALREVGS
jgi:ABC-type nitrate/sulfonate/bicarbonate transport system substrate-binding protein